MTITAVKFMMTLCLSVYTLLCQAQVVDKKVLTLDGAKQAIAAAVASAEQDKEVAIAGANAASVVRPDANRRP